MVLTFTINTPQMLDAQQQAVRLAKLQGFSRAAILSVTQLEYGVYAIQVQAFK